MKGCFNLIQVSKQEMKALRKRFPNIQATRTVNKYYVTETNGVVSFLKNMARPESGDAKHV